MNRLKSPFQFIRIPSAAAALVACLLLLASCNRDDAIRVYRAPKESADSGAVAATMPSDAMAQIQAQFSDAAPDTPPLWDLPSGWKSVPADADPSQMKGMPGMNIQRYATLQINDAHPPAFLSVVPLGPELLSNERGGLLGNVIRWQGQVGLEPTPASELENYVRFVRVSGIPAFIADISGPGKDGQTPAQILAILLPHAHHIWSFKLIAPPDQIRDQATNIRAFFSSIHFADTPAAPASSQPLQGPLPAQAPQQGSAGEPTSPEAGITYDVPTGWKIEPPKMMRLASFTIERSGDAKGDGAEVIITRFPVNSVGNPVANVNRWRGEVGLGHMTTSDDFHSDETTVGDRKSMRMEFTGAAPAAKKLIVVIAKDTQSEYYFKIIGAADVVIQQKPLFEAFLRSVRFGR